MEAGEKGENMALSRSDGLRVALFSQASRLFLLGTDILGGADPWRTGGAALLGYRVPSSGSMLNWNDISSSPGCKSMFAALLVIPW